MKLCVLFPLLLAACAPAAPGSSTEADTGTDAGPAIVSCLTTDAAGALVRCDERFIACRPGERFQDGKCPAMARHICTNDGILKTEFYSTEAPSDICRLSGMTEVF